MSTATHLLIDVGNTRVKWRYCVGSGWRDDDPQGTETLGEVQVLAQQWRELDAKRVLLVCVASEDIYRQLSTTLSAAHPSIAIRRIVSTKSLCSMRNDYCQPEQLGADRWVAAIGAHALYPGRALVIVSMGTATTIDVVLPVSAPDLHERARFRGGVILPGVDLMRAALAHGTARLPLAAGHYAAIADNTDDAIIGGILHAQAGAIERVCRAAQVDPCWEPRFGEPLCLIGGGAATQLAPLLAARELPAQTQLISDLVLRGLDQIARHDAGQP